MGCLSLKFSLVIYWSLQTQTDIQHLNYVVFVKKIIGCFLQALQWSGLIFFFFFFFSTLFKFALSKLKIKNQRYLLVGWLGFMAY